MSSEIHGRLRLLVQFCIAMALALLALSVTAQPGTWPWQQTPSFLPAEAVLTLPPAVVAGDETSLVAEVAPGYYIYRQSLVLRDAAGERVPLVLPDGQTREDEFFGVTEVYSGPVLSLYFPSKVHAPLTLHWQACAEAGLCYPPQQTLVSLEGGERLNGSGTMAVPSPAASFRVSEPVVSRSNSAVPAPVLGEDQQAARRLADTGPWAASLLFFGFGLLLTFTPCTLPMIPIVSAVVVGSQARPRRALVLSVTYVLAMAATYALLGVVAGLAGANLQATLQSPWLLGSFAALFLVLAASLFGAFELRLPTALADRLTLASRHRQGGSLPGAAVLGLLSALLVGPCMTAPLAGALLYIGEQGSAWQGGLALFALGLGMGGPLIAIAVFGARILPRPGPWMQSVRQVFGFVLAAVAVMLLARFLPASLVLGLWGAWGMGGAIAVLAWAESLSTRPGARWGLRYLAVLIALWSALLVAGAAGGGTSWWQPLAAWRGAASAPAPTPAYASVNTVEDVSRRVGMAVARGQWTLIDFYADWCVSCHEIERQVFGNPAVAARLAAMQVLRPDVTRYDAEDQALMRQWGVQGPPTLILLGPDGQERRAQRVVGEIGADGFLARLDAAGVP